MRRFCSFEADIVWIRSGLQYSGVQWSKLPKFILSSDLFKFHTGLRNFIALMAFLSQKHRFLTAKSSCAVPELLMALGHCVKKAQEGPIGKKKRDQKEETEKPGTKKKQALFGVCLRFSDVPYLCWETPGGILRAVGSVYLGIHVSHLMQTCLFSTKRFACWSLAVSPQCYHWPLNFQLNFLFRPIEVLLCLSRNWDFFEVPVQYLATYDNKRDVKGGKLITPGVFAKRNLGIQMHGKHLQTSEVVYRLKEEIWAITTSDVVPNPDVNGLGCSLVATLNDARRCVPRIMNQQ